MPSVNAPARIHRETSDTCGPCPRSPTMIIGSTQAAKPVAFWPEQHRKEQAHACSGAWAAPGSDEPTSGRLVQPVLDDEPTDSAVFQRAIVSHQRGLMLDRRTRDQQIKVALLPTDAFKLSMLRGVPSYLPTTARPNGSIGKVSVICLMRAPFCSLRTDFGAEKQLSKQMQRGCQRRSARRRRGG